MAAVSVKDVKMKYSDHDIVKLFLLFYTLIGLFTINRIDVLRGLTLLLICWTGWEILFKKRGDDL